MKMQMEIRTNSRSLFAAQEQRTGTEKRKKKAEVHQRTKQWMLCGVLIGILTISGYIGTARQETGQAPAAPVIARSVQPEADDSVSFEQVKSKHEAQRERELAVLEEVLKDSAADAETKAQANEQKVQIIRRSETEAAIEAALAHMGHEQTAAVAADERVIVIMPSAEVQESETIQIIDAVCAVSGCDAKDVKIILAKK